MNAIEKIEKIIKEFTTNDLHIAVAESCTGGYISHMITNVSGASKVFERGIVSYSNEAKIEILKVDSGIIQEFGAVSHQVAKKMAENVRSISKVNIGIGITGIAGPLGGSKEKPVGLVYIGFSTESETFIEKKVFKTDRITFKKKVLEEVILMLINYLKIMHKAE